MYGSFKNTTEPGIRKLLQCNICKRETIHSLESKCTGSWTEEERELFGYDDFSIYRCGGCDEVCFEKVSYFSELWDHDRNGNIFFIPDERQYPAPSSAEFAVNTEHTPKELNELIDEVLYAIHGNKLKLATVGLRMLIEFITTDKQCLGNNLYDKIEDLKNKNYIDEVQTGLLHRLRTKGNDSAHERLAMNTKEMIAGIGVINLLLEKLYNGPARELTTIKQAEHILADNKSTSFGEKKRNS